MSEFQKLWAGQTVSLLGTALTNFALPTLAVLVLHATPPQVGAIAALETLPFPVLGMLVGVIADRYSRRHIMIAADWVRFVVLASVPVAAFLGVLKLPQLYAVALVSGTASAFFGITYQSYLPVLVPAEQLAGANAKLEFSNSASQMAGSALAGGFVQWIGAAGAIAIDAASYLVSVASLGLIRTREPKHDGPPLSLRQGFREIGEGLRFVLHASDLRWIAAATATTNLGGSMVNAVILIYAYRILHLKPGLLGLAFGLAELGFVGALFSTKVRRRFGLRASLAVALLGAAFGTAALLLGQLAWPYLVMFGGYAIVTIATPIYNINQISYRQALTSVSMQGRVNATMRTFVWATLPLGALAGGYLGAVIGIPATIAVGAAICSLAALWLVSFRERAELLE
ncbi:MAG: MFS transporter [Candidatus Cybelea sp.]